MFGHWSGPDWDEFDSWDPYGEELPGYQRPPLVCRNCKADGMFWGKTKRGKWLLFSMETEKVHDCPIRPTNPGD